MLKGLLMASGWLTLYALNRKDADYRWAILYSLLNCAWLMCVLFAIFEHNVVSILISIAYPAIITAFGIRNRKKAKENAEKADKQD